MAIKHLSTGVVVLSSFIFSHAWPARAEPSYFDGNGHWYEAVLVAGRISWEEARTAAQNRGGHLATITSAEENDFVYGLISGNSAFFRLSPTGSYWGPWIGGFRCPGWRWVTGESWSYARWARDQPGPSEAYVHYWWWDGSSRAATWNDVDGTGGPGVPGYIVEYESPPPAHLLGSIGITKPQVGVGESFEVYATITNTGGAGDLGGISISFPDLTENDPSIPPNDPPYNSAKADVTTHGGSTFSTVLYADVGDTIYNDSGSMPAQHLLVEGQEASWPAGQQRTLKLTVTPKQPGILKIRLRGWICVTGQGCSRDPSSSGTGREQDQQGYWSQMLQVIVGNCLIVDGSGVLGPPSLDLAGNQQYDAVRIINNGRITVPQATWNGTGWDGGWLRLITNALYVDATSSMSADGAGYHHFDQHSGGGPGKGEDSDRIPYLPGGGGYAGAGGQLPFCGSGGSPYAHCTEIDYSEGAPQMGSRGGNWFVRLPWPDWPYWQDVQAVGGAGGGALEIIAQDVIIEGTISANGDAGAIINGAPGGYGSGGGSGGQIVIDSPCVHIKPGGRIEAIGGNTSIAGAGGGGKILVASTSDGFTKEGTISAAGGVAVDAPDANGQAGTVCTPAEGCAPGNPVSSAPTALDLKPDDDTGRSGMDHLTRLATPRIIGDAPSLSYIELYEGVTKIGSGTSDGSGQMNAQVTTALADGSHTISAKAQQHCHGISPISTASVVVTVDTQPPAAPAAPDLPPNSDTGVHDDDNITRDWGPHIVGMVPPDSDVTLYEGSRVLGTTYTTDGAWQIMSSPLSEGTHQITAAAKDAAGNESPRSSAVSLLVDLTSPIITSTSVVPTDCRPVGAVFTLSMAASDGLSGMAPASWQEARLRKDSTQLTVNLATVNGNQYSGAWNSTGCAAGTYAVDFRAVDVAGNQGWIEDAATICLSPAIGSDYDLDGDVDLTDFARFQECFNGPNRPYGPPFCAAADTDGDGDVDVNDFAVFQLCFNGSSRPPACSP